MFPLRFRSTHRDSRIRNLSAGQDYVTISGPRFSSSLSFKVFDFGNVVPDLLLRLPLTQSALTLLERVFPTNYNNPREKGLKCNRQLLQSAICFTIAASAPASFHRLMTIESRSRQPGAQQDDILNLALIHQAVIQGRSAMLIYLLKQLESSPASNSVTDTDLITTINEAVVNQLPEFQTTTRFLAMEVAAKWQMAALMTAGHRAVRDCACWPPRISFSEDGGTVWQEWFIPRDQNYDFLDIFPF
jgi:hypothetical protein